jgi:phenylacetate-CoA ligase
MILQNPKTPVVSDSDFLHHDQLRAFGRRLARTERMPPDELHAERAALVSKLLAHARQHVDFYKDRIDLDLGSHDSLCHGWSQIPILTRAEAAQHRERLFSKSPPREAGPIIAKQTSGSTGVPLHYRSTAAFERANCALTERMFRWWRVDGRKSFAQIVTSRLPTPSPQGVSSSGWLSARPTGKKHSLAHTFDIDTQLQWLLARKPAYLTSFAAILKELAATAKARGIALELDLVFSVAAVLDLETRDLCRSAFGAEIADTYGAQEAGHLAAQCPDCGEYHVSADATVVEILRDDGSPAAAGEIGRVIVTPLHNYAMPLIRYELGDFAEAGAPVPSCGRRLPTLRRILGRDRNLFRFRDGTRVWPVATRFFLEEFMPLRQFQIIQTDLDCIEIKYVPKGIPAPVDLDALTRRVRTVLGQPVAVTVCAVDKIERAATGKFEDCISLVKPGWRDVS